MERLELSKGMLLGVILSSALLLGVDSPAAAQTSGTLHYGVGYIASPPDLMVGGGGYVIFPVMGGLGIYVDGKFDIDDPADRLGFRSDLTPPNVLPGSNYIKGDEKWQAFNVALVRPLNQFLMVYAGAGYSKSTAYRLYEKVLGDAVQAYWVASPEEDATHVNFLTGLILRLSPRFSSHFGYETQPKGVTVGISMRFPAW